VTDQGNGGIAGNTVPEVSAESAQRLKAEADRLFMESARLGALADLARAQSEIVLAVIDRREMLTEAEAGLDQAQTARARATAVLDAVSSEVNQVLTELQTLDPENVADLEARLAARARHYALHPGA